MAEKCLVVGDIGGTNARFALANQTHPGFRAVVELKCADFETSGDAIRTFLDRVGAGVPDAMCLAAAGPVVDGSIKVTNNHWEVSSEHLASSFDVDAVRLLNDFEAIAYSLPFIAAEDRTVIGRTQGVALAGRDFNVAVLGPGTGLGVAGLLGRQGQLFPVTGEGGHVWFAPETTRQSELLDALRDRLRQLNPAAPVCDSRDARADPMQLFAQSARDDSRRVRPAIDKAALDSHTHASGVSSFCLAFEPALDWTAFGVWMTMLLNRHGDKVLRIKGMLNIAGVPGPVFINGVQHIVHPPTHLPAWPDQDRRSRVVFIIRDLKREQLEESLRVFNALAA